MKTMLVTIFITIWVLSGAIIGGGYQMQNQLNTQQEQLNDIEQMTNTILQHHQLRGM